MKLAFTVGYKGDNFAGSQAQPEKRTVEGEFIAAGKRNNADARTGIRGGEGGTTRGRSTDE